MRGVVEKSELSTSVLLSAFGKAVTVDRRYHKKVAMLQLHDEAIMGSVPDQFLHIGSFSLMISVKSIPNDI